MYALMCYKTALLIEFLITHITSIRAFITVCVDVSSDRTSDGMPYHTHHKYNSAHHYVWVDVLEDGSFD
jgi:hypothetical protein